MVKLVVHGANFVEDKPHWAVAAKSAEATTRHARPPLGSPPVVPPAISSAVSVRPSASTVHLTVFPPVCAPPPSAATAATNPNTPASSHAMRRVRSGSLSEPHAPPQPTLSRVGPRSRGAASLFEPREAVQGGTPRLGGNAPRHERFSIDGRAAATSESVCSIRRQQRCHYSCRPHQRRWRRFCDRARCRHRRNHSALHGGARDRSGGAQCVGRGLDGRSERRFVTSDRSEAAAASRSREALVAAAFAPVQHDERTGALGAMWACRGAGDAQDADLSSEPLHLCTRVRRCVNGRMRDRPSVNGLIA